MKSKLAVSNALYLKPLLVGLDNVDSPFELIVDSPAMNAVKLSKRSEGIKNAFLSPIDYARYGGEYCIVPNICVSSFRNRNSIKLFIKPKISNVESIAVDVRFASEIVLANIILKEKFKNLPSHNKIKIIPTASNLDEMFAKTDAILYVSEFPEKVDLSSEFSIDLIEEWYDMTELPYVFGFWVGREEDTTEEELQAFFDAKNKGMLSKQQIISKASADYRLEYQVVYDYLSEFSYDFGESEKESLSEFIHYAYYHGIITDVPEIRFFDI